MNESPFAELRAARQRIGLSQSKLAHKAGVSLATVQNIEAGRSNPAWSTLQALADILGLKFEVKPYGRVTTWEELAALGCPLMIEPASRESKSQPERERLIYALQNSASRLKSAGAREKKAVIAWLGAIRDHYPSVFAHCPAEIQTKLAAEAPPSPKLRRIALSRLGTFL